MGFARWRLVLLPFDLPALQLDVEFPNLVSTALQIQLQFPILQVLCKYLGRS